MNDLTGTLVMTGATRGLGREAAEALLRTRRDLHLLLLVRGAQGAGLTGHLIARTGNPNVSALPCDLSSLSDVRDAGEAVTRQLDAGTLPPLRGLLGNAGVQLSSAATATVDGFETTFGVNVLSHYTLLRSLLDRFNGPGRIVLTTSATHFGDFAHNYGMVPAPRWEPLERLATPGTEPTAGTRAAGFRAYATSKLALVHLVHALARRLPPGIDTFSYNPGFVPGTGIVRDSSRAARAVFRGVLPVLTLSSRVAMSPTTAGARLAAAFTSPAPGPSGSYIDRGTAAASSPASYDPDREDALWRTAAQLCGLPPDDSGGPCA